MIGGLFARRHDQALTEREVQERLRSQARTPFVDVVELPDRELDETPDDGGSDDRDR